MIYYYCIATNREKKNCIKRISKSINLACWRKTKGRKVGISQVGELKKRRKSAAEEFHF